MPFSLELLLNLVGFSSFSSAHSLVNFSFLLTLICLLIFVKISESTSSLFSYVDVLGLISTDLSNFPLLLLLTVSFLDSISSGSSKWFLIRNSSQLSPTFFKWNSISILIRPWWCRAVSRNWSIFWTLEAILFKLLSRKKGKCISSSKNSSSVWYDRHTRRRTYPYMLWFFVKLTTYSSVYFSKLY